MGNLFWVASFWLHYCAVSFFPLNEASHHNFLRKTLAFVKIEQNELSTRDVINTQISQICLKNLNLFSIWEQCSKTFQVRNIRMIIIN
jgi:hypothetical protein